MTPVGLLAQTLDGLRARSGFDIDCVEDVIAGCGSPVGEQGGCIGRAAVLASSYSEQVPGQQVHRFCASGLEAVSLAAAKVMSGQCDVVVGGGVESMSRIPMGSSGGAWVSDPSLAFEINYIPQGISADLIATQQGFTREDLDAYALESQRRASNAQEQGFFERSLLPVKDSIGRSLLDRDEYNRPGTSMDDLAKLKPAFEGFGKLGYDDVALHKFPETGVIHHVHTAGNSSGIVDGAGVVLVGSDQAGARLNHTARARIVSFASVGTDPTLMLTGPAPAAMLALKKAGMTTNDIDLFELNEAFAAVVLLFMRELAIDHERINVNGGSIAFGHPIGATGAMILGIVLDELERRDLNTALVNLCVGAGMGTALIIERV